MGLLVLHASPYTAPYIAILAGEKLNSVNLILLSSRIILPPPGIGDQAFYVISSEAFSATSSLEVSSKFAAISTYVPGIELSVAWQCEFL